MKKGRKCVILCLLVTAVFVMPISAFDREISDNELKDSCNVTAYLNGGWLEERDGVKILHVSGTNYEMGYQHGYLLREEIQEREIFLSLKLRPQWIVKKMLDIALSFKKDIIIFVHFVQEDICEDICPQIVENLRELGIKVISYNKKHTIQKIVF